MVYIYPYVRTDVYPYVMNPRKSADLDHEHPVDADGVARARERLLPAEDATRLASVLSLLADPVRSRILYALDLVEELCVGDWPWPSARPRTPLATACASCALRAWSRPARTAAFVLPAGQQLSEPLLERCLRQFVVLSRAAEGLDGDDR